MMASALVPIHPTAIQTYSPSAEKARDYARRSRAKNTLDAYEGDWKDFTAWCASNSVVALPATPEIVASYIADHAQNHKASTVTRRLSAISQVHQWRGFDSPTRNELVRSVLKGIRRTLGTAPDEKAPLVAADVREMVAALPDSLIGIRDRAILLVGFASACRRSEITSLDVEDLSFGEDGLTIHLRRSKTDQEGIGRRIGVPHLPHSTACPVRAMRAWLSASGITTGAVFRPVALGGKIQQARLSAHAVAVIVKRRLPKGKDATKYAGHSLRAGHVSAAANGGASMKAIMNQTGHRSVQTVMRYIRDASLFRGNSVGATGL